MRRRGRHCQDVGGAIVCGVAPTAKGRAEVDAFRRYLAGEMEPAERLAYTGLDGGETSGLGSVALLEEVRAGRGTFRQAREASGLTLGQTTKLTGWPRARVVELELEDGEPPTEAERRVICGLFDVAGFVPTPGREVRRG